MKTTKKKYNDIFRLKEVVDQPALPFTKPPVCGGETCHLNEAGRIVHHPPCIACRRIYYGFGKLPQSYIWLVEYVQRDSRAYIPQWATPGQIRAHQNSGKLPLEPFEVYDPTI